MRIDRSFFSSSFSIAFFIWIGCACDSSRLYEHHIELEDGQWHVVDTLEFDLQGFKVSPDKALVGIRYTDDYEYHNLYLRYIVKDSLGQVQNDSMVNIALFDAKSGKPLGGGFGKHYTKFDTLPVEFDPMIMPSRFSLVHYMREEELMGLSSIGIKLLKGK